MRAAQALSDTIGLVRASSREAEMLRAAAGGDTVALGTLSPELHAFVASFLDDDQRQEIGEADIVDIILELSRFRLLGADEIPDASRGRTRARAFSARKFHAARAGRGRCTRQ